MDQASTLPRSRSPRPPISLAKGPCGAVSAPSPDVTAAHSPVDHSGLEALSDPGEEPESPGGRPSPAPLAHENDGTGDPLAEPIAALLGAVLAVVTLLVPILAVVTIPIESSTGPHVSPDPIPAVSRSRPIETVTGPAAAVSP
jgi:hypothetical protein